MTTAKLRLLQTTDLHMQLLGFDYAASREDATIGLAGLIPTITAARNEGIATLLFDNGDFLQGNPLADHVARRGPTADIHPMIQAFNDLGYDAITLGNHEFDYGLDYLRAVTADCAMPVVCANARTGPTACFVQPWVIRDCAITCADGSQQTLRVGVIGFVTPQVVDWNAHVLKGALQTDDIVAAARSHIPAMKRAGADLVVALCHAGISDRPFQSGMENAALPLAALQGVDVIFAGHTHDHFPGPVFADKEGVDIEAATLFGKPAVMAGALGDTLGVIDLDLSFTSDGWQVTAHQVRVVRPRAGNEPTEPQTALITRVQPDHAATLHDLHRLVCRTPRRLTSYFAALGHDDTAPLVAAATASAVRDGLKDTEFASLPLLATTSPYRAGGHGGVRNYTDIAPGDLTYQHTAAIVPFDNPVAAVLQRGWQLRQWLERGSVYFQTLVAGRSDQLLVNPKVPAYRFDTFHGLRYRYDLRVAPQLDDHMTHSTRVRDLTYQGHPVADDDLFLVATTSYRAHGGGGLNTIPPESIIWSSPRGLGQIFNDHLQTHCVPEAPPEPGWSFVPVAGSCTAILQTAPLAREVIPEQPAVRWLDDANAANGFASFAVTL